MASGEPGMPADGSDDMMPETIGAGASGGEHGIPGRDDGNGDRRRRRRGRRGGRRNRRDRDDHFDGPPMTGAAEHMADEPFHEPVATPHPRDEWTPPQPVPSAEVVRENDHPAHEAPAARFEAVEHVAPSPVMHEPAAAVAPEAPKRRSTVREPAPVFGEAAPVAVPPPPPEPVPAPAITSAAESEDANRPRRTGWWAKRLLGGGKG
jgi:ribonuclease E